MSEPGNETKGGSELARRLAAGAFVITAEITPPVSTNPEDLLRRAVVEDFGFDACIDYKNDDLPAALKQHCPKRVDVYFDNVGGPILNAVLGRLANNARVVLCGVISSYLTGEHPGPANYVNLLSKTASMQGFNALDEWGRFDEAFAALRQWEHEGRIKHRQTIFEGVESCVDALNGLFTGANIGKMLVKLSEPTTA